MNTTDGRDADAHYTVDASESIAPHEYTLDVVASCCEVTGTREDAAYNLCGYGLTVDEFIEELRETLKGGFGLYNANGPCSLHIHIGIAGIEDESAMEYRAKEKGSEG